ncbi:MAG: ATP synthase subunit I [Anaerovoracaceae bacterium]
MKKNNVLKVLKIVLKFDIVIIVLSFVLTTVLFREYLIAVMVGLIIAVFNFALNTYTTNYLVQINKGKVLHSLSSVFRIIIALFAAFAVFNNNGFNILGFVIGYNLHYIAIILYAVTQKKQRS